MNHSFLCATTIRARIDAWDEFQSGGENERNTGATVQFEQITLGSKQDSCTFAAVEREHSKDLAFHRFRLRFAEWINWWAGAEVQANNKYLRLLPGDSVSKSISQCVLF